MTMKEIDELRVVADAAIEYARRVCPERCGLCTACGDIEYTEAAVLDALRQWWVQDCKDPIVLTQVKGGA